MTGQRERGWTTEHGTGRWRVWSEAGGWHWEVFFPGGQRSTKGPYGSELGADRAGRNCIKRWEHDARLRALDARRDARRSAP